MVLQRPRFKSWYSQLPCLASIKGILWRTNWQVRFFLCPWQGS